MPVRPLYSCTAHICGSRDNAVFLPAVTATEIAVLRVLHGNGDLGSEPVVNITPLNKGVDRSDEQERARIAARYQAQGKFNGLVVLNALYGVGARLPLVYEPPARVAGDPVDVPTPEEEKIVILEPEGPITSVPEPEAAKKTKKESSLLDA
jgi:hypothetical protein